MISEKGIEEILYLRIFKDKHPDPKREWEKQKTI